MWPATTTQALVLAAGGAVVVAVTKQGSVAGAAAGMAVATAMILGLGPATLPPLALFVLGSGALTKLGGSRKRAMSVAEANEGKRGVRHVAAKLAIPALLAVTAGLTGGGPLYAFAFACALAGAFADTAATEVGPLGRGPALTAGKRGFTRVPHGTPGAVSAEGLAASAVASLAVAFLASACGLLRGGSQAVMVAAGAGFAAALLESFIAPARLGRRMGHFGRNVFVSASATALGWTIGFTLWGSSP